MNWTFTIGPRTFVLDQALARQVLAGKKIINGKVSEAFNLLPLRYPWSYDLYVALKKANWGPYAGEIPNLVATDISDGKIPNHRGFINTAVGFLAPRGSCSESRITEVIREKVTAPELKLILGRRPQEENIGLYCFLFVTDRLHIDPAQCSRGFWDSPTVREIFDLCGREAGSICRTMSLASPEEQRKLARAVFFLGACLKGVQFQSIYTEIASLGRSGRFPALSTIFQNRRRDEDFHVEFLRRLFLNLLSENPAIRSADFDAELIALMGETVALEKNFVRGRLADDSDGGRAERSNALVDLIAQRRLADFGLGGTLPRAALGVQAELMETRFAADFPDLEKSSLIDPGMSDDDL